MLGSLGRGSHHSVVAGITHKSLLHRTYHPLTYELLRLNRQQRLVEKSILVRDSVFNNKFPEAARVNGVFRLTPEQRRDTHYNDVMTAIRKRSIMLRRIERATAVNAVATRTRQEQVHGGEGALNEGELNEVQKSLVTPDSDFYFMSMKQQMQKLKSQLQQEGKIRAGAAQQPRLWTTHNAWPNFWQHPSRRDALVPRPKWERHPELGGITRVHSPVSEYSGHY